MVLQPRSMKQGDESIDDFVDLDDRYVDMRQESTYFHGFLLIALALGEILVSIVLALRIVILWFFLILSPFLAVLPVFSFYSWCFFGIGFGSLDGGFSWSAYCDVSLYFYFHLATHRNSYLRAVLKDLPEHRFFQTQRIFKCMLQELFTEKEEIWEVQQNS